MTELGILRPATMNEVYQRNVGHLKRYNENTYKLVYMKSCRQSGYEDSAQNAAKGTKNTAGNTAKLNESLSRTRSTVYELALCNEWEHFITFTVSPDKYDRYDLRGYYKSFAKWINNLNFRKKLNIKHLIIPEQHKDGAWHLHGLFMGIPQGMLTRFTVNDTLPHRVLNLIREGRELFNWGEYAEKYGHVTCERIQNLEATAKYVTKYITKDLGESGVELNHHLYYASKGLNRAETIIKGTLCEEFEPDFANEYVAVKTFKTLAEAIVYFAEGDSYAPPVTHDSLLTRFQRRLERRTTRWKNIPCPQT